MPIAIHGSGDATPYWNYSNQSKNDYSPTLEGTIVEIAEVQDTQWNGTTQVPKFWPDGNPIMAIRLTIVNVLTGEDTYYRFPLGKNSQMVKAIERAMPQSNDLEDLAGAYVRITSPAGVYNRQNPRPFTLEIAGYNKDMYRGTKYFDPNSVQQNNQSQQGNGFQNNQQGNGFAQPQGNPQNFQGNQQGGFQNQQGQGFQNNQQQGGFQNQQGQGFQNQQGQGQGFGSQQQGGFNQNSGGATNAGNANQPVGQGFGNQQQGFAGNQQANQGQAGNNGNVFAGNNSSQASVYDEDIPF